MNREEMLGKVKAIVATEAVYGIDIYTGIKVGDLYTLKRLKATDKLRACARKLIGGTIETRYLDAEIEYESSENVADNKKAFYGVVQDDEYKPFDFLANYQAADFYNDEDRKNLTGFFFRINLNDNVIWAYQHVYSMSRIDKSKHIFARLTGNNTYDDIEEDIVQIDARVDLLVLGQSIVTAKVDLLQEHFGFEKYIRAGAQQTIEIIKEMDIVTGLEKFIALENKSKLTNAKKLLKAKNSPVLRMRSDVLIDRIKEHSQYSSMFLIEDDHITIKSQKDAAAFIKMVNDDYVRSELTGQEYDSSTKLLL